jgi:branched-chain amino acid transport system substrate-binding protein
VIYGRIALRHFLLNIFASAAIIAICSSGAAAEILIGMAGALTGPYAYQGEQQQQGVELAVADLNARGGILGHQLKIITVDDACDSEQAIAAAYKLVASKVSFVVGHQCSGASISASEIYARSHIVQITPSSTNPQLTERGQLNVFRMCGRDDQQGAIAGEFLIRHWQHAKIAIISDNSVYGRGLTQETRDYLNRNGVTEALYEDLTPGQSDYSSLIARLQSAQINVVYFGGYYREAALLIRDAQDQGYTIRLISGDSIASEAFGQVTGKAGDGTLFTSFRDPRPTPEAEDVVARFRQSGFEPEGYTLYSYGAVQTWAQAAIKAGSIESEGVIAALRAHEFDTIIGRISFDSKGDVKQPVFEWFIWRDGHYTPLE